MRCISLSVSGQQQTYFDERDNFYKCYICGSKCDFFITMGVEDKYGRYSREFQTCSGHMQLVHEKLLGTSAGEYYDETRDIFV